MKFFALILAFLLLLAPLAVVATDTLFVVQETEYCLVTEFGGKVERVIEEPGWQWRIPWYNELHFYPKRARSIDSPPEHIVTGDAKKLVVDNYVKWRIADPEKFRERLVVRGDTPAGYLRRATERISIITHNALKDILGSEILAEIIASNRDSIATRTRDLAIPEGEELGIEIIDVRIKRVELPKVNVEKAYERMQAQRNKEAHYYRSRGQEQAVIIRAEADKEVTTLLANAHKKAELIRAEADAQAAQIYADSYNRDSEFYGYYRSLQALRKTMDTATTLVITPESELYRYLVKP
jgi:membrane protease subunit HflC